MTNILEKITKDKKNALAIVKKEKSLDSIEKTIKELKFYSDFKDAIKKNKGVSLISEITFMVLLGSDRSTWIWSDAPPGQGQRSSNGFLEQVSTLQPSEENRLTVAWPMPLLAPVKTKVLFDLSFTIFALLWHILSNWG